MGLNFLLLTRQFLRIKNDVSNSFLFVMAVNNQPLKTKFDIWKSRAYVHTDKAHEKFFLKKLCV